MRLTCPNCEAQYEVSDSVIPLHGRDVQCSNCGQTWFQGHPSAEPDPAEDDDNQPETGDGPADEPDGSWIDPAPETPATVTAMTAPGESGDAPAPAAEIAPMAAGATETTLDPATAYSFDDDDDDHDDDAGEPPVGATATMPGAQAANSPPAADPAAAPTDGRRRSLDEAVLSVLREEAEREARARMAAGGVETQTDLNLSQPPSAPRATSALPKLRIQSVAETTPGDAAAAGLRRPVEDLSTPFDSDDDEGGDETGNSGPARPARASRRDLLPDIEEINSSLHADGANGRAAAAAAAAEAGYAPMVERRGGFRTGFLLIVAIAAAVIGLYAAAPALGSRFPAAVPALNGFVTAVDKGRMAIDALMQKTLDRLKGADGPAQ